MRYIKALFISIAIILACQPKVIKEKPLTVVPEIVTPRIALIEIEAENARKSPNGEIMGQLLKGDTLYIINRQANWLFTNSEFFDSVYIWAPSAGLEYLNLYHPLVYYDSSTTEFYPLNYFQRLFSDPGKEKSISGIESEIVFSEIGLGSHQDIIVEVVQEEIETVVHGISLYLRKPQRTIHKIKIDFFKPVQGIEETLQICGLPYRQPSSENGGHVIWKAGLLIPGLEIDLERKEWHSEWFSAIWISKEMR